MAVDVDHDARSSGASPDVAVGSPADRTRVRRAWGLVCATVVGLGYTLILASNPRFFYQDDSEASYVPAWIDIGTWLRSGDLPFLVPGQWMAGNYAVEGQYGLFNPVQHIVSLVASSADDLVLFATLVKLVFAVILATGVYRTALEYGASPHWAAAAGAAMPFSGFTLFYDSASGVAGLMGSAWLAQAWASSVRFSRGRSSPLPAFAFLYLAISIGYAHVAVMAGVLVGCLVVAELLAQRWGGALRQLGVGVAAALCALIAFLPGYLSVDVTWRGDLIDPLQNDGFLSAAWSESLALSLPSMLPAVTGFAGPVQLSPITYVAWFVLPALAFVRWNAVAARLHELSGPVLLLTASLLITAGPSLVGPLRWPARLLPYLAMSALVLFAILVSRFLCRQVTVNRLLAAAGLICVNVVRAASANPDLLKRHLTAGALVALLVIAALVLGRLLGGQAAAVWLLLSILPVAALMVAWYPRNFNVNQWNMPTDRSEAMETFPEYPGSTLQIGSYDLVSPEERTLEEAWGELTFANYARMLQRDYVNALTPVGFRPFSDLLCMDYAGSTCREAYGRVFDIEETTGRTVADLMALDRVVLQREMFPELPKGAPPDGWDVVDTTDTVFVLERTTPRPDDASRVSATLGVVVESVVATGGEVDHVTVTSPSGGTVVFSRLAWPGYQATVDGEPAEVSVVDDLFVAVKVPPTEQPVDLRLSYRPPGMGVGIASAMIGIVLLAGLVVLTRRRSPEGSTVQTDA